MKKSLFLLTVLLSLVSANLFAGSRTFYFQATAESTDDALGLVFASFSNAAPTADRYADSLTTEVFSKTASQIFGTPSNTSTTLYLYAQAAEGVRFLGWTTNPEAEPVVYASTNANYSVSVTSNKYNAETPATFHYYAVFEVATEFYSSIVTAKAVGPFGSVSVSDTAASTVFADSMAFSQLNTILPAHRYYLQAKSVDADSASFAGWYSDAECTNRLSQNATYTYNVTATSLDSLQPTEFPVYAKFNKLHYYSSKVSAAVVGEGGVAVALQSSATVEYASEAELAQLNQLSKPEHTYYLKADDDYLVFEGWYSDVACTELISNNHFYTYKVAAESQDTLAPTLYQVYAKFISDTVRTSPFQFRNAGFEVWNAAENEPAPGWNGPASAVGGYVSIAGGMAPAPEKVEGREGGNAVMLTSKSVSILFSTVKTNGNLTTGVMNMGSATATSADNNNHTVLDDPNHRLIIAGQPDSLVYYSKFKKGENKDYLASAKVYIHDAVADYQDPIKASQNSHLMGYCYTPAPESEDWIRNAGAFEYDYEGWDFETVQATTKYVLCDLTTNPTAGGSTKDTLVIDDIALIYNSELASAVYGEDTVLFTNGENADFLAETFDEQSLELVANGRGASVETEYNSATGALTITVSGQDVEYNESNVHVYTMYFKPSIVTSLEGVVDHSACTVEGIYDIMGRRLESMQPGVNVVRMSDGTTRKIYR